LAEYTRLSTWQPLAAPPQKKTALTRFKAVNAVDFVTTAISKPLVVVVVVARNHLVPAHSIPVAVVAHRNNNDVDGRRR